MSDSPALTALSRFSGCGAKLGPDFLDRALCGLSQPFFPELLVDFRNSDDAGIWQLDRETALVQTVDFFPPIVDDPFTFGRIAAANALSDVYAMGGRPITALGIVAFPEEGVDIEILRKIMHGALDALGEAGAALVGGHSVKDRELKFGLAVTGLVHPLRALRNNRLESGDGMILTKPLGTGCVSHALKAGRADAESITAANFSMAALNKRAAEILSEFPVHACTDVTGFGFLGHVCEMMMDSGCGVRIHSRKIETLPGAENYIAQGLVPGGTLSNRNYRQRWIKNAENLEDEVLNLLFDPQTSGGLLTALPAEAVRETVEALREAGVPAFEVGEVFGGEQQIEVVH